MSAWLTRVARLTAGEKLAVNLLRGADGQVPAPSAEPAFEALVQCARDLGMNIQPASNQCLGYDEAKLLAGLTLMQRHNPDQLIDIDPLLHPLLRDAAAALTVAGVRLNYRNVVRASASAHRHLSTAELLTSPRTTKEASVSDPFGNFAVQAQIFQYVDAHGTVWFRELHRQGATRHLISMMCRRGLLRRVRHGVYSAGFRGATLAASRSDVEAV